MLLSNRQRLLILQMGSRQRRFVLTPGIIRIMKHKNNNKLLIINDNSS